MWQLRWKSIPLFSKWILSAHLQIWHCRCKNVHTNGKSNIREKWTGTVHNVSISWQVVTRGRLHSQQSRVWSHVSVQSCQNLGKDQQVVSKIYSSGNSWNSRYQGQTVCGKNLLLDPKCSSKHEGDLKRRLWSTNKRCFRCWKISSWLKTQTTINVSENIISGAARYHPVRGWQGGEQEEEEYRPDQRGDDFFPHSA